MEACYSLGNIITSGTRLHLGHILHWTELEIIALKVCFSISITAAVRFLLSPDQTKPLTKTLPIAEWFICQGQADHCVIRRFQAPFLCSLSCSCSFLKILVLLSMLLAMLMVLLILLCTWVHLQIQHQWLHGSQNSFSFRQSMDKLFGKAPTVKGEILKFIS